MSDFTQDVLAYIEANGIAQVTDKQLPAAIRETMIQSDASCAVRIQDESGAYHLMLLSASEVHAATATNFGIERYAQAKRRYGK